MSGYVWHSAKYHTARTPVYVVLTAVYAVRGIGVLVVRVLAYLTDAEARPLALSAVRRDNVEEYRAGHRATMFSLDDKGIGLLDPGTSVPVIARTPYLDGPTSDTIVTRARAMREAAGTLAGYCLGEQPDRGPRVNVLDDLQVVYAAAQLLPLP